VSSSPKVDPVVLKLTQSALRNRPTLNREKTPAVMAVPCLRGDATYMDEVFVIQRRKYACARCSDVSKLTPHGWKEHFAQQVQRDRRDLIERLVGSQPYC
jgi:hypothetical protein